MFYRKQSEDCIYLQSKRVLAKSPDWQQGGGGTPKGGKGKKGRKAWQVDESEHPSEPSSPLGKMELQKRQRRMGRFGDSVRDNIPSPEGKGNKGQAFRPPPQRMSLAARLAMSGGAHDDDVDWAALAIKGTLENPEKSYFRLTSAPDPSTVRPQHVLEAALARIDTLKRNYWCAPLESRVRPLPPAREILAAV
eukprot:1188362-Prorocentrum_minimum.AAC.7